MRSVLITGGTGSFGRAFVRRLLAEPAGENLFVVGGPAYWDGGPERICIYSRSEHAQAAMRAEFKNDPRLRWFIGDVRDAARLRVAMQGCDGVIHAAALKRIEVGQYNPTEMALTNVIGAMNVVEAASYAGVGRVVALSSDKAYQPISPYGQSKALAETIILAGNTERNGIRFAVTRYGNVAGSAGSVIPAWRKLIADGDTVPITDPDCTRFWMTMTQAVDFVLKAIDEMPREVMIPDLPAYRLIDLAEAMGVQNSRTVGLPSWEKLHESMDDERRSQFVRRMSIDELREALKNV